MFWRFGFANASAIDSLLDREDVALEAVLDEDELLQECKAQNARLSAYLSRPEVLTRLLGYVTGAIEPPGEPEAARHKYPYVCAEVLCSDLWPVVEGCLADDGCLLGRFWETVLDRPPEDMKARVSMAAHFAKINGVFMGRKPKEMWAFIRAQPRVVERLLVHLECEPFLDLLVRILHDPVVPDITDWFSGQQLVPRLVGMLSSAHAPEMHAVVTELISRIVSMAAPAPGAGVNDGPGAPTSPTSNRFARELAARESVATLVGFVVQDFRPAATCEGDDLTVDDLPEYGPALPNMQSATSSVVSSIAVLVELIRKNNSDYFEPYLFHTLRNRLIQVQQQSAGQTEDNRQALEDAMREMVDRMGVVHLGPVLDVVCEHMDKIQSFLTKPRSSTGPVSTTVGEIPPLTMERYRICELYAELLHCSNMALLNRPAEYDRLYDAEGRLQGGLSAMEELAQVIAMGAGSGADADAMDASEDELEPAGELPVSDPSTGMGDSDEDMSSGASDDDDDDDMDDVAIDEHVASPSAVTPPADTTEPELRMPVARTPVARSPAPSPSPSPPLTRKGSGLISPSASPSASLISRPRSSHSRRSLRRVRRRESLPLEALPPGERLKQKFLDANILSDMLRLFFEFPWNNFLHSVVYDLVHQIVTGRVDSGLNQDLILALFRDARLMQRIVDGQKHNDAENAKPKGVRLGYMGHLTLMSEDVISALEHYPPDLRVLIGQCAPVPEWEEYVTGRYSETKQKDSSLLGGGKPVVAPGITRLGGQWKVDETEATPAASAAGPRTPEDEPEPRGEFKRATGSRPTREGSADFGPAPFQDDEDDEENESPQFNRYLAQEMKTTHQFDDNSDDEEDEGGGWLTRSSFGISSSSIARSTAREQALEFDDTFGATTSAALARFDDNFGTEEEDAFGPFSDSAATGEDPFSFSSSVVDELGDSATFDDFGAFGDFQSSNNEGQLTPTGEIWSSFTSADASSASLSDLSDSMEDFGGGHAAGAPPQGEAGKVEKAGSDSNVADAAASQPDTADSSKE